METPGSLSKLQLCQKGCPIQPIKALHPYGQFTVQAKIVAKYPKRNFTSSFGSGNVLTIEIMDEEGSKIEGSFWREQADKFENILEVDKVYRFSKFKVKLANKKYARVDEDYKIDFTAGSEVTLCDEQQMVGIQEKMKYVSFDKVHKYIERNTQIDVLSIVLEFGEEGTVKRKSSGEEISRRDLKLLDQSGLTINLTVWNQNVDSLRSIENNIGGEEPLIIGVTNCTVSDFNGVGLSMNTRSKLVVDPKHEEADKLRNWYKSHGQNIHLKTVADAMGLMPNRSSRVNQERETLKSVKEEFSEDEAKYASVFCYVGQIDPEGKLFYQAAPVEHKRKVIEQGAGEYYCEYDKQTYKEFQWGYAMQVEIIDCSASTQVSLLNEQAEILLGISASALNEMKVSDENKFRQTLLSAQWKQWDMLLQRKMREYKGERKLRVSISRLSPINYQLETQRMLQKIRQSNT
eukprot:TRINITY_DN4110_c0_g2_i1.p1 TRINITY_DN4110_c0_g2~~TRINITY_DN4110_c0_g2_i1.p1  ORF type:complete len:461 (-),score=50.46 TRINITY_DN4110_c0_g2_i1:396-1778(-)